MFDLWGESVAVPLPGLNLEMEDVSIKEKLYQIIDATMPRESDNTHESGQVTILTPFEEVLHNKISEEREVANRVRLALESDIRDLQSTIQKVTDKSNKLEEISGQLKSSYRIPEQWAQYQGKKEVLEGLAKIYQEIFLTNNKAANSQITRWILNRLEKLLKINGVTEFGQIKSHHIYNPTTHEFIPGSVIKGTEIQIICPGFEVQDHQEVKLFSLEHRWRHIQGLRMRYSLGIDFGATVPPVTAQRNIV